jgi:hypothetical protein
MKLSEKKYCRLHDEEGLPLINAVQWVVDCSVFNISLCRSGSILPCWAKLQYKLTNLSLYKLSETFNSYRNY